MDIKFGRSKDDPLLASEERVKAWRKAFEVKPNGNKLTMPDYDSRWKDTCKDLVILSSKYPKYTSRDVQKNAQVLVVPSDYEGLEDEFLIGFTRLKKVVIVPQNYSSIEYNWNQKIMTFKRGVMVYGKRKHGESIEVRIRSKK